MSRYALGLDFGTESARALLVEVADGREAATAVQPFRHAVVDEALPGSGVRLDPDWALQDPDDYWESLEAVVPAVLREAGAAPEDVVGIGVDFTACTLVPTRADGTPLSRDPALRREPHAWAKLWKHHGAQPEAERINALAAERGEAFLARYGGKTPSPRLPPQAAPPVAEAPGIYPPA